LAIGIGFVTELLGHQGSCHEREQAQNRS
jgi:hypothetical protein